MNAKRSFAYYAFLEVTFENSNPISGKNAVFEPIMLF
jgi:hypothetical protein